jgi:hypothetical protein
MHINPKLQQLVDVFFQSFNRQKVFCQVNDLERRYVFLNDYFETQDTIINHKRAYGKTICECFHEYRHPYHIEYPSELDELYKEVMQNQQRKSFFAYSRNCDDQEFIRLANVFPLLASDGELLGTYTLSWFANPLNFLHYFQNNFCQQINDYSLLDNHQPAHELTKREHQILFLLLYNFSQYQIGDFLHISRGTVQKVINEKICPKLNINPPSVPQLVEYANSIKLQYYFPPSLLGYRIIELYNDESFIRSLASQISQTTSQK